MDRRIQNKRLLILAFVLGFCLPFLWAALGDIEVIGDLLFTATNKGVRFYTGDGYYVWLKGPSSEASYTLRLPSALYTGYFMSVDGDGQIQFLSTASYDGDIQSVWNDDSGDVSGMTAASGDTLDATSADSTIPWKVNATAEPTTEGAAIWDSDGDYLAVGDGTNTLTMISVINLPPTSASGTGVTGQMAFDSQYAYRCIATNTWKRLQMSTWTDSYLLWPDGTKILWPAGDFIIFTE